MYTLRANLEIISPNQSTLDDRTALLELIKSALADTDIESTIVNLDHLY
jgi:hypothetical protein